MKSDELIQLMKDLVLLRRCRTIRDAAIPLISRFRFYQNIIRRRVKYQWTDAVYVLTDDNDYYYIPDRMDTCASKLLLKKLRGKILVDKFCKPGDTVLDVGANIGTWSLPMAKAVGPGGRLLSFEPTPVMCDAVNKTLRVNAMVNARCYQVAVSNKNGSADFFLHTGATENAVPDSGRSSLEYSSSESSEKIEVRTVALDDFLSGMDIKKISFIKIDIEGHEYAALQGAKETLKKDTPVLVIETGQDEVDSRALIADFLIDLNYEIIGYEIDEGIVPVDWEGFISFDSVSNFIFFPKMVVRE